MARSFSLSVVAPDRSVVETIATSMIAPGAEGYFGVMAGHVPSVAFLKPGLMEYTEESGMSATVAVHGGFIEVSEGRVTVLADAADLKGEIDIAKAEAELEQARAVLRGEASSSMTREEATKALDVAMNRIRTVKR